MKTYGRVRAQGFLDLLPRNTDFYLTLNYIVYDANVEKDGYDDYMRVNEVDKCEIYLNGALYSFTYFTHSTYVSGLNVWNNDASPLFVGVSLAYAQNNLYYIKGKVYSCRLYERSLSSAEVKGNYDSTLQFRNSEL